MVARPRGAVEGPRLMADKAEDLGRRAGFFAIDRRLWRRVTLLEMNAAVAYLVLARGSGRDQRTTQWSTNAVEDRTGISRPRAKEAIGRLVNDGLVVIKKGGTRPVYELAQLAIGRAIKKAQPADWIWLPNELIDGAAGETTPVELCRQSGNVGALFLLVELYHSHALQYLGGIQPQSLKEGYERHRVGERGSYVIWGFSTGQRAASRALHDVFKTGKRGEPGSGYEDRDRGDMLFWQAVGVLQDTGLIEYVPHVFNADPEKEGELMHPYGWPKGEPEERAIAIAAHQAGFAMLDHDKRAAAAAGSKSMFLLVPALKHFREITMVGIARLRYRPHTKATAAWYDPDKWRDWAARYSALQHQGDINGVSKGNQRDIS